MTLRKTSRIIASILACAVTGGLLPVTAGAQEDNTNSGELTELIVNGSFETDELSWTSNFSKQFTTDDIYEDPLGANGRSLYVTGRWNIWAAPMYKIPAEAGKTYTIKADVMYNGSDYEEMDFQILVGENYDGGYDKYLNQGTTVKKGEWATLTAECTIPADAELAEDVYVSVQTVDWDLADNAGISFYLDNVSVTVDSGSGETPTVSEDPSVTAPPAQEPDENGRLCYYDFDGSPADTSEIFRGGMSLTEDGGVSGNSARFDGTDGYIQLPDNVISKEMSFMAWVKPAAAREWARVFDLGSDTDNNFFFAPGYGKVELKIGGQITNEIWLEKHDRANVWELYAVTVSEDMLRVYRDGVLIGEQAFTADITALTQGSNYIGKSHYDWDANFYGEMDDISIYARVLTEDEIKAEYDRIAGGLDDKYARSDRDSLELDRFISAGASLPTVGQSESVITWECSDSSVIALDMSINTPAAGEPDKSVTFTATITNGTASYTKEFESVILAEPSLKDIEDYPMSAVEMKNSYLNNANDKMKAYLMDIDLDRYVAGFREMAGIEHDAEPYGGWENSLIAGHSVGHYITALAQEYAYSEAGEHDAAVIEKLNALVDALSEAQIKEDGIVQGQPVKAGYLFAATAKNWYDFTPMYGEQQFDNVEAGKGNIIEEAWVPWYTMHKILAGLIDAYKLTGNEKALETASKLGDWVYNRVKDYDTTVLESGITLQQQVLNIEYGGMNDALYELYKLTGKADHAKAAHMFDEISLFDELYNGNDVLAGKHANTTIPKILGALNRYRTYEETGEKLLTDSPDTHDMDYYLTVAENFWDMVVNDHSYITGGNSENEHFREPHTEDAYRNNVNCETCNTYNMLKLSRELYKITGDRKYADYYETTFLNAIVSSQNPETGMTMYFQPMASGYFKVYSDPYENFWCCTGSGMESMTKLNDSIYYHKDDTVIVDQYISSVLTDKENGIVITQESDLPNGTTARFTVTSSDQESTEQKDSGVSENGWTVTARKTVNDESISVSGTVQNNSGSASTVSVYTAAYENGVLKALDKTDLSVDNTQTKDFSAELKAAADAEVRIFVWNADMSPVVSSFAAETPGSSGDDGTEVALALRIPDWTAGEPVIKVNGTEADYVQSAGYVTVTGLGNNDTVEITLPMEMQAYGLADSDTAVAFKYGPVVLSAGLGEIIINKNTENTESHGMGVRKPIRMDELNEYIVIDPEYGTRSEWLAALNDNIEKTDGKLEFRLKNTDRGDLVFTSHYSKYNEYYGIYWYLTTPDDEDEDAILAAKQAGREANITIDSIEPGHDQQENGHGWKGENTTFAEGVGDVLNYRSIAEGGYVDYQMAVDPSVKNYVSVTYVGDDAGKMMNIYAGDVKIAEVTAGDRDETVRYEIPAEALENAYTADAGAATIEGKTALHIVFRAECGTDAPRLNGTVKIVTDYSTDPSLESLTFEGAQLIPKFDPDVTEYELDAGDDGTISMKAVPSDRYGLVYVNGRLINDAVTRTVNVTSETLVITVKAEDHETEREYVINFR